jgi:hypothetical protein
MPALWRTTFLLCAVFVAGCDDGAMDHFDASKPDRLVEWMNKYHSMGYKEIQFSDGTLSMQTDDNAGIDEIFDAGSKVHRILKGYVKAAENQSFLRAVRITYRSELVDKYRNSIGIKPILTIRFNASEAMKYNLENSYAFQMVDTAIVEYTHPVQANAVQRYCGSNGQYSPQFCRRSLVTR